MSQNENLSPQGYNYGVEPYNENPFWKDEGGGGTVGDINATASVTNTVGTPSVIVTKRTGTDSVTFDFAFQNLKGEQGIQGVQGVQGEQGIQGIQGEKGEKGDTGATGAKGEKGDTGATGAKGEKGEKGDTGATPIISALATINSSSGTPSVSVMKSGTDESPNFTFAFQNLKGEQGIQGEKGATGEQGEQGIQGIQGVQGEKGEKGDTGATGANGVTFTPSLTASQDGNYATLAFTNDGDLTNPSPINIPIYSYKKNFGIANLHDIALLDQNSSDIGAMLRAKYGECYIEYSAPQYTGFNTLRNEDMLFAKLGTADWNSGWPAQPGASQFNQIIFPNKDSIVKPTMFGEIRYGEYFTTASFTVDASQTSTANGGGIYIPEATTGLYYVGASGTQRVSKNGIAYLDMIDKTLTMTSSLTYGTDFSFGGYSGGTDLGVTLTCTFGMALSRQTSYSVDYTYLLGLSPSDFTSMTYANSLTTVYMPVYSLDYTGLWLPDRQQSVESTTSSSLGADWDGTQTFNFWWDMDCYNNNNQFAEYYVGRCMNAGQTNMFARRNNGANSSYTDMLPVKQMQLSFASQLPVATYVANIGNVIYKLN